MKTSTNPTDKTYIIEKKERYCPRQLFYKETICPLPSYPVDCFTMSLAKAMPFETSEAAMAKIETLSGFENGTVTYVVRETGTQNQEERVEI